MLGDDVILALDELRAQAESLHTTTCTITREGALGTHPATGAPVRNPVPVWPAAFGQQGLCQLVDTELQPQEAGQDPQLRSVGIVIRITAAAADAGIRIGDLVEAGGRRFTVRRVVAKTMMVVLRLVCDELPPTIVEDL